MSESDVPDWDTIMERLLAEGRTDEALTIAHMLAFERWVYGVMAQDKARNEGPAA